MSSYNQTKHPDETVPSSWFSLKKCTMEHYHRSVVSTHIYTHCCIGTFIDIEWDEEEWPVQNIVENKWKKRCGKIIAHGNA